MELVASSHYTLIDHCIVLSIIIINVMHCLILLIGTSVILWECSIDKFITCKIILQRF